LLIFVVFNNVTYITDKGLYPVGDISVKTAVLAAKKPRCILLQQFGV